MPGIAILLSGCLQPSTLEALRHLVSLQVPTLILVNGLTEHHEELLLGSGALDVIGMPATDSDVAVSAIDIFPDRRLARVGEVTLQLTRTEFDLLVALARRSQHVLTREQLSELVIGRNLGARALESHLSRLRRKL